MDYSDIRNRFAKKKILVIGDVVLDRYSKGTTFISPEAPILALIVESEDYKAGAAGNVALNVSNLSERSDVYLFSFIGDDLEGNLLKNFLNEKDIHYFFDTDHRTIVKHRFIGTKPGRPQQIFRADWECSGIKIFSENTKNTLEKLAKVCDQIIISDYAKGTVNEDLIDQLRPYKFKMIIDPKPKNKDFKELYREASVITPNIKEALEMSGCSDVYDAGKMLRNSLKTNILITAGKDGMILFPITKENYVEIPTKSEEEYEETGAGDTAIAAITLAITSGYSLEDAAKIGNYASGITIKKVGTYAPTIEELMSVISLNRI